MRRVAVTGIGVVSSIGTGKDAFWKALLEGKTGISPVALFDTAEFPVHIGGEVKDFDASRYLSAAYYTAYYVASDGRFLFVEPPPAPGVQVVVGWSSELAARLAARH